MTVDEILASGTYTDRRGREWYVVGGDSNLGPAWVYNEEPFGPAALIGTHHMRLLIERDMHRDECVGIAECDTHPVVTVILHRTFEHWLVFNESSFFPTGAPHDSLDEALSVARALAVGE